MTTAMITAVIGTLYLISIMLALLGALIITKLPGCAVFFLAVSLLYWLMGARAWRMRK